MKLDKYDVESVAKGRVNRTEGRRSNMWFIGSGAVVIIGLLVGNKLPESMSMVGLVVAAVGILALFYYMNTLSKKQNSLKRKLLKEWQEEQK